MLRARMRVTGIRSAACLNTCNYFSLLYLKIQPQIITLTRPRSATSVSAWLIWPRDFAYSTLSPLFSLLRCMSAGYSRAQSGFIQLAYSYLSASMGSRLAALAAGRMPNSTPTKPEKPNASAIDHNGILAWGNEGIVLEIRVPRP